MTQLDPKSKNFILDIYTNEGIIKKQYKLQLLDALPEKILQDVKMEKQPSGDEDIGILPGIKVINIENSEEIKTSLSRAFLNLGQKILDTNKLTDAGDYMRSYKALSTMQGVLYKQ